MSLKTKIFAVSSLVAFALLSIVGIFSYTQVKAELSRSTILQLTQIAEDKRGEIQRVIDMYAQRLTLFSVDEKIKKVAKTQSKDEALELEKLFQQRYPDFSEVSIFGENGDLISSTNDNNPRNLNKKIGKFTTGGVLVHTFYDHINMPKLLMTIPVYDELKHRAYIQVVATASMYTSLSNTALSIGETGEIVLAKNDPTGDSAMILPTQFGQEILFLQSSGSNKYLIPSIVASHGEELELSDRDVHDYRSVPVFAVTRYIDSLDAGVVAKVDQSEAFKLLGTLLQTYIVTLLFSILLIAILSFVGASIITKPLRALLDAVHELQKGNFKTKASVLSHDEIGEVARAFNAMSGKLHSVYLNLEDIIDEKTHKLAEQLEHTKKAKKRTSNLLKAVKEEKKNVAEEKALVEATVANIGYGVVAVDKDKNVLIANKSACELLKTTQKALIGSKWPGKFHPVDEEGKKLSVDKLPINVALETGEQYIDTDHFYVRSDKKRFNASITATPIKNGKQTIGAVTIFRDITEEKEIDKAKTEFVSMASHQLRTPLATVNWYVEMLMDGDAGDLNEDQVEYLREISLGNQRMIDMVDSLLNVSRIDLGRFNMNSTRINVAETLSHITHELQPQLNSKDLKIKTVLKKRAAYIEGDKSLMRNVFLNLLSNAIKYSHENGTIEARVEQHKSGDTVGGKKLRSENIVISISDKGIGIPLSQQRKVFTKLFRANNARKAVVEGSGLGLYLAKTITEKSGGKIWFESEKDEGTTFYVALPVAKPATTTRRKKS